MTTATNVTILHEIDYQDDRVLDQYGRPNGIGLPQQEIAASERKHSINNNGISKTGLHLYLPKLGRNKPDAGAKLPLVVYVHGGGWRRGDKRQWRHFISSYDTNLLFALIFRLTRLFDNIGETFARNGVPCAVISYPLQRAHILVILLELFLSFCMSTLVSISLFAFLILFYIYLCVPTGNHAASETIYMFDHRKFSTGLLKTLMSLCLIQSQIFTWCIIAFNIKNYKNGLPKCILISVPSALLMFGCYSWFNPTNFHATLWTLSVLLTVFLQTSIATSQLYHHAFNWKSITCEDQTKAVAKSLKWLKTFGDKTHQFDSSKIVLFGHSAGSHLINMLIWDEKYLQDSDLSKSDVKGIISLSGVHNLESMNRGLTRRLYLSTFGSDPDVWAKLSPINHITRCTSSVPEFLIVTAQNDFDFLKKDAREYVEKLEQCGYKVSYEVILSCNHLSLPMNFGSEESDNALELICLDFVQRCK